MENSILKIFGSVDVKITPDYCTSAPQNDRLNLSFVKGKDVVGQTWPDMV